MNLAVNDVMNGARNYQFWMTFGMNDIKTKYRRSKLGQWWITLSVALFVFIIGILYQSILDATDVNYMAYLAVGYILWLTISEIFQLSCQVLIQSKLFLLQKNTSVSLFIYRLIYREILTVMHHMVLLPPIFLYYQIWPGVLNILLALIGFTIAIIAAFWAAIILAIVSLRYRDVAPIVSSLIRLAFFATPIIWIHRDLGFYGNLIVALNPFKYFISVVRIPLLGGELPLENWIVVISITGCLAFLALWLLGRTRQRITYWL